MSPIVTLLIKYVLHHLLQDFKTFYLTRVYQQGALSKRLPNPNSFMILEQNIASFIIKAASTSSASMVDFAVSPCNPTLKLTGPSERNAR